MKYFVGIVIISAMILLKRKFDPHNDAFRIQERPGWHLKKADVIDITKWKRKVKR